MLVINNEAKVAKGHQEISVFYTEMLNKKPTFEKGKQRLALQNGDLGLTSSITKKTMTKIDPIIAVKDVESSSKWYQSVFDCRSLHGGKEFDILVAENDEILICLHKWGEHHHPTMTNPGITPGNGLILYFRTENMNAIRQNIEKISGIVEEDIHLNPNSLKKEFSLRDPDGYYLTISEFHKYEG